MVNFNNGDAKASSEYYKEDAIVAPPNSPEVKGKEAIETGKDVAERMGELYRERAKLTPRHW